jgi:hypothetical protein
MVEVILVGTKCECEDQAVTGDDARDFADRNGIPAFFVSAMNGQNVNAVLEYLAQRYEIRRREGVEAFPNAIRSQPMKVKKCC